MENTTSYEHLRNEIVQDEFTKMYFTKVRDNANSFELHLSDDDFRRFIKLYVAGIDIKWIMHKMGEYKLSLTDALVSYITY